MMTQRPCHLTNSARVLIVDDERYKRQILEIMLATEAVMFL